VTFRSIGVVVALLVVLPVEAAAAGLTVEVAEGTLSVTAQSAPLSEVLLAIGEQARARVRIESVLAASLGTQRVTGAFTRVPMEEGLRRLLRGRNFLLGYGPDGVDEIRVFVDGTSGFSDLVAAPSAAAPASKAALIEAQRRAEAEAERPYQRPPDDPVRLAQWRKTAMTSDDPDARVAALEELQQIRDHRFLVATLTEVMTRERDPDVVNRLLDVAEDHVLLMGASLRTFAASDHTVASRVRVLEMLGEHDGADPRTRTLLRALSTHDGSARVRETAQQVLRDLESPPAPPTPEPLSVKRGPP
jgi:hypothetical protein